jgi:hypothetical protein
MATTGPIDDTLQGLIAIATADLASRLSVEPGAISVLTATAMTWPDKSLGCPQPGMQYLQVLVDGALIELQAGAKTYSYHSGDDGKPALCEQTLSGTAIPPSTS